jgi:hypothetical protein
MFSFKPKKLYSILTPDHVIFDKFLRDAAYHVVKGIDANNRKCFINYSLSNGETITISTLIGWNNPRNPNFKKKNKICLFEVKYG